MRDIVLIFVMFIAALVFVLATAMPSKAAPGLRASGGRVLTASLWLLLLSCLVLVVLSMVDI